MIVRHGLNAYGFLNLIYGCLETIYLINQSSWWLCLSWTREDLIKFQYLARISMNLVGDCGVTLYIMPMSVILWALDDHCISLVNFSISVQSYSNQSPGRNTSYIKCNILIPNWLVFGWKHKSKLLDTASSGNLINLPLKRGLAWMKPHMICLW